MKEARWEEGVMVKRRSDENLAILHRGKPNSHGSTKSAKGGKQHLPTIRRARYLSMVPLRVKPVVDWPVGKSFSGGSLAELYRYCGRGGATRKKVIIVELSPYIISANHLGTTIFSPVTPSTSRDGIGIFVRQKLPVCDTVADI